MTKRKSQIFYELRDFENKIQIQIFSFLVSQNTKSRSQRRIQILALAAEVDNIEGDS